MTNELQAASNDLIQTKTELARVRLAAAQEREQTYAEMHKLANTVVESRQHLKDAKELELQLRQKLQNYDEKFTGLQSELEKTNSGYKTFSGEMDKVDNCGLCCYMQPLYYDVFATSGF